MLIDDTVAEYLHEITGVSAKQPTSFFRHSYPCEICGCKSMEIYFIFYLFNIEIKDKE